MCLYIYSVLTAPSNFFCTENCFLRTLPRHAGLETRVLILSVRVVSLRLPANDFDLGVFFDGAFVS